MVAWKGYAKLLLDMTKYVGSGQSTHNRAQIRQDMRGMGDRGEHTGLFMAHETDVPMKDAFPSRWEVCWGDALD
jgi:hypothetical protein